MRSWLRVGAASALVIVAVVSGSVPAWGYGGEPAVPVIAVSTTDVTAGESLTVQGADFTPLGSAELTLHSAPVFLARVAVDGQGSFDLVVTVPTGTTPGTHTIEALDVPTGNVASIQITVSAVPIDPTPPLAGTGVATVSLLVLASVLVLAGVILVVGGPVRRSRINPRGQL